MKSQLNLFQFASAKSAHGGLLKKGKRKVARPFVPKKPIHLVLRSSRAKGPLSMLRPEHCKKVDRILKSQSRKHFVKVCEYVNVGNHLHLKIKARTRPSFQAFLISTTALIARAITGAKKGQAKGRFWDALAFTRVLTTRFEEWGLAKYFDANAFEAKFGHEIRLIFEGKVPLVPI